ncbi:MAG: TIM-barrel fold metal-dependent hydrolase, partial [Hyphomicrobiales bacterium]|nr:TIM-barrel fold metal-dependent hydrolase [Hyphomicrobiales bacterium]
MNVQTPAIEVRELHFVRFSSSDSLAKAAEQARKRNYQDFLIVDVDSHHYESESYAEVF